MRSTSFYCAYLSLRESSKLNPVSSFHSILPHRQEKTLCIERFMQEPPGIHNPLPPKLQGTSVLICKVNHTFYKSPEGISLWTTSQAWLLRLHAPYMQKSWEVDGEMLFDNIQTPTTDAAIVCARTAVMSVNSWLINEFSSFQWLWIMRGLHSRAGCLLTAGHLIVSLFPG